MRVKVLSEYGYKEALLGMGLSFGITSDYDLYQLTLSDNYETYERLVKRANVLDSMDGGHNKFLESITVYLDIDAGLYFWKQFDTYRIGISKQSESTMHTLMKQPISLDDFEDGSVDGPTFARLERLRVDKEFKLLIYALPSGYLQRRIICTNYKTLRHIYKQRKNHKLDEWRYFCEELVKQLKYPEHIIK